MAIVRFLNRSIVCLLLFLLITPALIAQKKDSVEAHIYSRYMSTSNKGDLTDFSILISYGKLFYHRKMNGWLSLGGQVGALANYGTSNLTKTDPTTGSGAIYEGNLWNAGSMDGSVETTISQLYAQADFGKHRIMLGRFLKDTPILNAEPWPFPNAMEGIWYENNISNQWKLQLAGIWKVAPRQTGKFVNIGASIDDTGVGVDVNGNPSQYRGQINSDYLAIANLTYQPSEILVIDVWNLLIDNVNNNFVLEPKLTFKETGWNAQARFLYQSRVGDGGNANQDLTYMADGPFSEAYLYGLRIEKKIKGHLFQFNFSRIADQGRLLVTKAWAREPMYTFQRRTRIEGSADVTAFTLVWQNTWNGQVGDLRIIVGAGRTDMPDPTDATKNKFQTPSYSHWDTSWKYSFKRGFLKNFSAEVHAAYRFLASDIASENYRINRADFLHLDCMVGWKL